MDIGDLIAVYLTEGDAEGVRGDMAFAQAVAETGYFTNSDTSVNNFAGIAHYDGAASGAGFADPLIGVRAHIQLLKKYAGGNDVSLANPDVSPYAVASASTWGGLAGTWATSPTYWNLLSDVYGSILEAAGQTAAMPWDGTSAAARPATWRLLATKRSQWSAAGTASIPSGSRSPTTTTPPLTSRCPPARRCSP